MNKGIMKKMLDAKIAGKNEKGFTLVELMIVVAIIGILAAIAIPQFAAYRIKAFNTSALSDLRNVATGQTGMFADFQTFGVGVADVAIAAPMIYAGATGGVGAILTGPPAAVANTHTIQATIAGLNRGFNVGLSNQVSLIAQTEAITAANPRAASFLMLSKHLNGNTYYAQDSDSEVIYQDFFDGSNGTILAASGLVSVQGTNQLAGVNGYSGAAWAIK